MGCGGSKEKKEVKGAADADPDAPPANLQNFMVEQKLVELGVPSADDAFKQCADVANKCAEYGGELMDKVTGLQKNIMEKAAAAMPGAGGEEERVQGHGEKGDLKESLMSALGSAPEVLEMMKKKIPDAVVVKAQELAALPGGMELTPTKLIAKLAEEGGQMVEIFKGIMPNVDVASLKKGVLNLKLPEFDLDCLGEGARALWDMLVDFVTAIIEFAKRAIGEMVAEIQEAVDAVKGLSMDGMQAEFDKLGLSSMQKLSKAKDFKSNMGIGSTIKDYGSKLYDMIMLVVGHLQRFFNMIVGKCIMTAKAAAAAAAPAVAAAMDKVAEATEAAKDKVAEATAATMDKVAEASKDKEPEAKTAALEEAAV